MSDTIARRDLIRGGLALAGAAALGGAGVALAPQARAADVASRTYSGSHPVPFTNGSIAYGAIMTYSDRSSPYSSVVRAHRNRLNIRNDTTGQLTVRNVAFTTKPDGSSRLVGSVGWGILDPGQTTGRLLVDIGYEDAYFRDGLDSTWDSNLRSIVYFYRTNQNPGPVIYSFNLWYRVSAPYPYTTRNY